MRPNISRRAPIPKTQLYDLPRQIGDYNAIVGVNIKGTYYIPYNLTLNSKIVGDDRFNYPFSKAKEALYRGVKEVIEKVTYNLDNIHITLHYGGFQSMNTKIKKQNFNLLDLKQHLEDEEMFEAKLDTLLARGMLTVDADFGEKMKEEIFNVEVLPHFKEDRGLLVNTKMLESLPTVLIEEFGAFNVSDGDYYDELYFMDPSRMTIEFYSEEVVRNIESMIALGTIEKPDITDIRGIGPKTSYEQIKIGSGPIFSYTGLDKIPTKSFKHIGYECHDFNVFGNNCLIACFRNHENSNYKLRSKQYKTLRRHLFPTLADTEPLTIADHIPKLEREFELTCCVITGPIVKKVHFDDPEDVIRVGEEATTEENINKFKAIVTFEHTFLYGNADATLWIYLDTSNEIAHAYAVKAIIPPKTCPITGEYTVLVKNKTQLIKILKEQKRIDKDCPDTICGRDSKGRFAKGNKAAKKNGITKSIRTKPKKEKKPKGPNYYCVIDFETVYDFSGRLIIYSYCIYGPVLDPEDEINYNYVFYDCSERAEDNLIVDLGAIRQALYSENARCTLLTWNGSKFDNFLMVSVLSRAGWLKGDAIFLAGNSLLGFNFSLFKSIDANRHISGSLAMASRAYNVKHQKTNMAGLTHTQIQALFMLCNCNLEAFIVRLNMNLSSQIDKSNKPYGYEHFIENFGSINNTLTTYGTKKNDEYTQLPGFIYYNIVDCVATFEVFYKYSEAMIRKKEDLLEKGLLSGCDKVLPSQEDIEKGIQKVKKLHPRDCMTLGSYTYKMFTFYLNKLPYSVTAPDNEEAWKFVRECVYGGRVQAYNAGKTEGVFMSLDVKSLYPFAMLNNTDPNPVAYVKKVVKDDKEIYINSTKDDPEAVIMRTYETTTYGTGRLIKTDKYVPNKIGFYNAKILKQPECKIIPKKEKGKPLNWFSEDVLECKVTNVDIETIIEFGGEIEIYDGYYKENHDPNVFHDFLLPFKDEKTNQDILAKNKDPTYNPALRECCKSIMNIVAGKTQQRIFRNDGYILSKPEDIYDFIIKHDDVNIIPLESDDNLHMCVGIRKYENDEAKEEDYRRLAKPIELGCLVYSYSRRHVYKAVLSKIKSKTYGDTDSVHMDLTKQEVLDMMNNQERGYGKFNMGGEFGDFEDELGNYKMSLKEIELTSNLIQAVAAEINKHQNGISEEMYHILYNEFINSGLLNIKGSFSVANFKDLFKLRRLICYYVAPKVYAVFDANTKKQVKAKFKGVGRNDKFIPAEKRTEVKNNIGMFQTLVKNMEKNLEQTLEQVRLMKQMFIDYNNLEPALSMGFYEDLNEGREVAILCSSIRKNIEVLNEESFTLNQRFLVKTINKGGDVFEVEVERPTSSLLTEDNVQNEELKKIFAAELIL